MVCSVTEGGERSFQSSRVVGFTLSFFFRIAGHRILSVACCSDVGKKADGDIEALGALAVNASLRSGEGRGRLVGCQTVSRCRNKSAGHNGSVQQLGGVGRTCHSRRVRPCDTRA